MLKLIYGTAGSGKTERVYEIACERAKKGEKTVLIVPEQYSFETERRMLLTLGAHDAQNVEVHSFRRLAQRLCESGAEIDDCARAALMSVALGNTADYLELYSKKRHNVDFVSHMLDAVKELKLCAISPKELETAADRSTSPILKMKMRELSLVCAEYDRLAGETGIDPLDSLNRLTEYLNEHRYFDGKTVLIDSFRGFTGQETAVISQIMAQAQECVITLCSDGERAKDNGVGLFSSVNKTAARLIREANKHSVSVAVPEKLTKGQRFKSKALAKIEEGLYRFGVSRYEADAPEVTVYNAEDVQDEARFACREIRRLMREENMRPRDIAVIVRAEDRYARFISEEAQAQEIPLFMDRREPVDYSPLVRFVRTAVEMAGGRWQGEDVLRLLKCGMIEGITAEDTALCEEYAFMWELSGEAWKNEFTADPDGFGSVMDEEKKERLNRINSVREKLCTLLVPFCAGMKDADGAKRAKSIYLLLERAGSAEMIRELCSSLPPQDAENQAQVWDKLMLILDKLASVTKGLNQSEEDFSRLLSLMLSAATVGQIPRGVDEVTFGAADRVRTNAPKTVFILGAAQGVFPARPASSGVFTDSERRMLIEMDIPVTEPSGEQAAEERLLAYNALCSASERIYMTCPASDGNETMAPGELITQIKNLVPGCRELYFGEPSADMAEASGAALELAARAGKNSVVGASLIKALSERNEFTGLLSVLENKPAQLDIKDKANAYALFGKDIFLSQAKAESYFECPFKFFCNYGLKAKKRRRAKLDPLEYGNVVHYVMEHTVRKHADDMTEFSRSPQLYDETLELLYDYLEQNMGGTDNKSPRFISLLTRMTFALGELIKNLGNEYEVSLFRPDRDALELSIGMHGEIKPPRISLSDGSICVSGKIDRVDSWGKYIRVIDYKTGAKAFSPSDILEGINMQLFMYMDALSASEKYKNCIPAGALYSPAAVSVGKAGRGEEKNKPVKMLGILVDDREALSAMEGGLCGNYIPAKAKKDGTYYQTSSVVSRDTFEKLCAKTREKLREMGDKLHEGRFAPYPVEGGVNSCDLCDFGGVCGVENAGEKGHTMEKTSLEELAQILDKEV